jgi:hypothetical protein
VSESHLARSRLSSHCHVPRGPHASDPTLFGPRVHADLRAAVEDLSWLLGHGYAENSSLKLVGDRHRLRTRQREAVRRSACSDAARERRRARRIAIADLKGRDLAIDGFNCVIVVESALAGGVLFRGRDGMLRDIASVHGSYRRVEVTHQALLALRDVLVEAAPASVTWYLDRPVSNSGRLREFILDIAPPGWTVELPNAVDPILAASSSVVATADANILDACTAFIDLPAAAQVDDAWIVDLCAER